MGWRNAAPGTKIAVWLSTASGVGVDCRLVVAEDATERVRVVSVSMREAQREITDQLITQGFKPLNRWLEPAADTHGEGEVVRDFVRV